MNNGIELDNHVLDEALLGEALLDLNCAMEKFMEMKHPMRKVLFHMVHSIMCYEEFYLRDAHGINGTEENWLKPTYPEIIKGEE